MLQPDPLRQYHTPQRKYDDVRVSTEKRIHRSQAVNYGRPIELEFYMVWCLKCDKECSTANVIDGEEVAGTIQEPVIYLWSAHCKNCLKEWFF
jgi:thiol:disulfide interchange protein